MTYEHLKELEEEFLRIALQKKREYDNTVWWKFKLKRELKSDWYSARDLMVYYGNKRHLIDEQRELFKNLIK